MNTLKAILNDKPRQSLRDLAGETGIPKETIRRILTETIHLKILRRFAVEDESWILFNTPQTKQQNKACMDPKKPRLQVVRPFLTNKKAMILFAFTGDGKVCIRAVSPGMTINLKFILIF